jgi:hypothetical protein
MKRTSLFAVALVVGAALVAVAGTGIAGAAGVSGPAIYVDGTLYRTVGTQTDFSGTGAPAGSYDVIYDFGGLQRNVAEVAPGDPGYNGGRWQVHALAFTSYAGALADDDVDLNHNNVLDSDEEVAAAIAQGYASDQGIVRYFECPLIKVPANS